MITLRMNHYIQQLLLELNILSNNINNYKTDQDHIYFYSNLLLHLLSCKNFTQWLLNKKSTIKNLCLWNYWNTWKNRCGLYLIHKRTYFFFVLVCHSKCNEILIRKDAKEHYLIPLNSLCCQVQLKPPTNSPLTTIHCMFLSVAVKFKSSQAPSQKLLMHLNIKTSSIFLALSSAIFFFKYFKDSFPVGF